MSIITEINSPVQLKDSLLVEPLSPYVTEITDVVNMPCDFWTAIAIHEIARDCTRLRRLVVKLSRLEIHPAGGDTPLKLYDSLGENGPFRMSAHFSLACEKLQYPFQLHSYIET